MSRPRRDQFVVDLLGTEIDWRAYAEALENFLDDGRPDEPGPGRARARDPQTAQAAAARNPGRRGTQRHQVFAAISEGGRTPDELVAATGIDYRSLTPRLGELESGGWIQKNGQTRPGSRGDPQAVRVLSAKGREWIEGIGL